MSGESLTARLEKLRKAETDTRSEARRLRIRAEQTKIAVEPAHAHPR